MLEIDFQLALKKTRQDSAVPSAVQVSHWANNAYQAVHELQSLPTNNEVTVRVVGSDEMQRLNHDFRAKPKPTNVLSFPVEMPAGLDLSLLGDIVICHDVVVAEASAEGKSVLQHYAHMVTHGVLHLCGYDHQCDDSAREMEALEAQILSASGVPNPYQ